MPHSLSPLTLGVPITDRNGGVTTLFLFRWQELIDGFQTTPTIAALDLTGQSAAVVATTVCIAQSGGLYRVNYALLRAVDDGVSSSAQVTIGWTQKGVARSLAFTALTEASGLAVQGQSLPIYVDANAGVTIAVAYASNTANRMQFDLHADAERMA